MSTDADLEQLIRSEFEAIEKLSDPRRFIESDRVATLIDDLLSLEGEPFAFESIHEKVRYFAGRWIERVSRPEVASQLMAAMVIGQGLVTQYGSVLSRSEYATLAAAVSYIVLDLMKHGSAQRGLEDR